MPKNKFQEVVFTVIMVFFMVYGMICYNICLNTGGMSNEVFLAAFHELVIMGPIAFILDFFIVSKLAFACLFKNAGSEFVAVWLQTTVFNFPMAFFLQLIYAGPVVRFIFRCIFREKESVNAKASAVR